MIFIYIEILSEPAFDKSSWGKEIFEGVCSAFSKKKIKFEVIDNTDALKPLASDQFLILIGSNEGWLKHTVFAANNLKIHPIVLTPTKSNSIKGIFSSVTSDIGRSMYYLINHLKKRGKTKPALYGINPASISDLAREESFLYYVEEGSNRSDIYYNNGSLKACFDEFFKNHNKYDCVICANDYAAISLIKNFEKKKALQNNLLTVSYGNTLLSRKFNEFLTISMCYEEYGRAAVSVCETLFKNPALLYVDIAVKWKIGINDDFAKNEPSDTLNSLNEVDCPSADRLFYGDTELHEMLLVENMLRSCDATDFKLLEAILSDNSYERAAELCFISLNTVKYRIKKLMEACNLSSKKDFLKLIKKYR